MDLVTMAASGHFTKAFQPEKKIPQSDIETLLAFMYSIPASVNVQPYHYIVISSEAGKQRIVKDMKGGAEMNIPKVRDTSHTIIFCTRLDVPEGHMQRIHELELQHGRFRPQDIERWTEVADGFVAFRRNGLKDLFHWMEKQTYMALGMTLMAANMLDINVSPLEGFDKAAVDKEFGLTEKGFTSTVLLGLGYRDVPHDFLVNLPKSRLPKNEIFEFID